MLFTSFCGPQGRKGHGPGPLFMWPAKRATHRATFLSWPCGPFQEIKGSAFHIYRGMQLVYSRATGPQGPWPRATFCVARKEGHSQGHFLSWPCGPFQEIKGSAFHIYRGMQLPRATGPQGPWPGATFYVARKEGHSQGHFLYGPQRGPHRGPLFIWPAKHDETAHVAITCLNGNAHVDMITLVAMVVLK